MMPYTDQEARWLAATADAAATPLRFEMVPEVVRRYGLEADYRRAEAISALLTQLGGAIGRLVRFARARLDRFRRSPL